jgi:hypothetical protein
MQVIGEYTSDIGNPGKRFWLDAMAYGRWSINESYLMTLMDKVWGVVKNLSSMTLTIDRLNRMDIDETHKNRLIAEVKCGRGLLAFMLYDFFGPIPLPDLETLKYPLEEKILPRATEEEMQAFIETGLLEAANAPELPYNYRKGDAGYGRFTKGMAWMALLKFYMQTRQWAKAEAAGRELLKSEYGYDLVPSYKDIFSLAGEKNVETIYSFNAMPANRGHSWQVQAAPPDYSANGASMPHGQNAHKLSWWFIDTYEPGDERLETIVMEYYDSNGMHHGRNEPNGPLEGGASAVKYEVSETAINDGWWSPIDMIHYRYADALTLLAEAIVRNGNAVTSEAIQLLNRVRTRALGQAKAYTAVSFGSPRDFLDKLLMERAHELFFENGSRRQDLIRDGSYAEKIIYKCNEAGETTLMEVLGENNATRFPIPQRIIDEGKGAILQNPGY